MQVALRVCPARVALRRRATMSITVGGSTNNTALIALQDLTNTARAS